MLENKQQQNKHLRHAQPDTMPRKQNMPTAVFF